MVIAVTGGYGFLGAQIAAQAALAGHEVVALGRPDQQIPSPGFSAALATAAPDAIVHAAGPASVARSVSHPEEDRAGSVEVFRAVLEDAENRPRPPRVALISSAAVYGQPERLPVSEDAPLLPVSPYGRHRAECEDLLSGYHDRSEAPVIGLRVFSAYGEGLRRQILWDVVRRAVEGPHVALGGTGDESRDFIHVQDVATAALLALEAAKGDSRLNVASGTETTIRDLVAGLLAALALPGREAVFSGEGRPGDPLRWRADTNRLSELGFTTAVPLELGLRRYADWARAL